MKSWNQSTKLYMNLTWVGYHVQCSYQNKVHYDTIVSKSRSGAYTDIQTGTTEVFLGQRDLLVTDWRKSSRSDPDAHKTD